MRRFLPALLAIVLLLTMAFGGCAPAPKPAPTDGSVPIETHQPPSWWWEHYMSDLSFLVQRDFPRPGSLYDDEMVLEGAVTRAGREGTLQNGLGTPPRSTIALITTEQLSHYAEIYFGREDFGGALLERNLSENYGLVGCYAVNLSTNPKSGDIGDWAFTVESTTLIDPSHVEVLITLSDQEDRAKRGELVYQRRFTFSHMGDEKYRLDRVVTEVVSEVLPATFTGEYTLTPWGDAQAGFRSAHATGVIGDVFYVVERSDTFRFTRIHGYSLTTGEHLYQEDFLQDYDSFHEALTIHGEELLLTGQQSFFHISPDLKEVVEERLPQATWNLPALSPDGKTAAFVTEEGIFHYELETGATTLLAAHPSYDPDGSFLENVLYAAPSFTADGAYLITPFHGYEWLAGYYVHSFVTGTGAYYPLTDYSSGYWGEPAGDWLFLGILQEGYDTPNGIFRNLVTGEEQQITFPSYHWGDSIPWEGDYYFLLTGEGGQVSPSTPAPLALYRVNPQEGTLTPTGFTSQNVELTLLYVRDGVATFSYFQAPAERANGLLTVPLTQQEGAD